MLNAVFHGEQQLLKHILLPLLLKSLIGNDNLLQSLNLCHNDAYSMTQQINTALRIQKIKSVGKSEIPLSHIIHPYVFITLGLYLLSGKTSYRQISGSLEAARLGVVMIVSL